jgi:hypothetical protein
MCMCMSNNRAAREVEESKRRQEEKERREAEQEATFQAQVRAEMARMQLLHQQTMQHNHAATMATVASSLSSSSSSSTSNDYHNNGITGNGHGAADHGNGSVGAPDEPQLSVGGQLMAWSVVIQSQELIDSMTPEEFEVYQQMVDVDA